MSTKFVYSYILDGSSKLAELFLHVSKSSIWGEVNSELLRESRWLTTWVVRGHDLRLSVVIKNPVSNFGQFSQLDSFSGEEDASDTDGHSIHLKEM
jgi:hypothetical protein